MCNSAAYKTSAVGPMAPAPPFAKKMQSTILDKAESSALKPAAKTAGAIKPMLLESSKRY